MPTMANPYVLTTDDKRRLSAALTKRIRPSIMPHTYRHVGDAARPCLFRVRDPETGSYLIADMTPNFRMRVVNFEHRC